MEKDLSNKKFIKIVYDLEGTDGIIVNCKDKEVLLIERDEELNESHNGDECKEKLNGNLKKAKEIIDLDRKGVLDKYIEENFNLERLTKDDEEFYNLYKLGGHKSIDDSQDSKNIDICKKSIEKVFNKIIAKLNGYKIAKDDSEFYKLIEDYQKYNETLHCLMKKDYPKLRELWKMN